MIRIALNTAPEGFFFAGAFAGLGSFQRFQQPALDAFVFSADPPDILLVSVATLLAVDVPFDPLPWPIVSSRGAGPVVAARVPIPLDQLGGHKTATPGPSMTETLAANTLLPSFLEMVVDDRPILPAIVSCEVDTGILWDHTQCDVAAAGLIVLEDLGARFAKYQDGLPLPLRCIAVRRDAPPDLRTTAENALAAAMNRLGSEREAVVEEIAISLNAAPAAIDAYLRRILHPNARLDAPDYQAALEVLRDYNDADYYAANGRF